MENIYSHLFNRSDGAEVSLADYKGKLLLLVNTATKCGLAPQFTQLEQIYQDYKDKGLVVIGFPCDQFGGQEPETNDNMAGVCQVNFGVTFALSQKINVNGPHAHPIFEYLKNNSRSRLGKDIKWNFTKFLVSTDGKKIRRYAPTTSPVSIRGDIEQYL